MKSICLVCGKENAGCFCERCGLLSNMEFDIIQQLNQIDLLMLLPFGYKIDYYKFAKDNTEIVFNPTGIYKVFCTCSSFGYIDSESRFAMKCLLSYLQNKNTNISTYASKFFEYMASIEPEYKNIYNFWKKKEIETGPHFAVELIDDKPINKKEVLAIIDILKNGTPYKRDSYSIIYNDRVSHLLHHIPLYLGSYRKTINEVTEKDIDKLTMEETIQYLTCLYRHENVYGGLIASAIDNGHLLKLLNHLLEMADETTSI